jgi:DNA replication and repair protein RecF
MPNLAVESLTLSHFRSHHVVQIKCDARPIAIYGANGAGKTNILEAVSLLSPGRGVRRASAEEMTRRPEALGWKVKAVLRSQGRLHEVETWSENGAARQVRIDSKAATQVMLGRIARVLVRGAECYRGTVFGDAPADGGEVIALVMLKTSIARLWRVSNGKSQHVY